MHTSELVLSFLVPQALSEGRGESQKISIQKILLYYYHHSLYLQQYLNLSVLLWTFFWTIGTYTHVVLNPQDLPQLHIVMARLLGKSTARIDLR